MLYQLSYTRSCGANASTRRGAGGSAGAGMAAAYRPGCSPREANHPS